MKPQSVGEFLGTAIAAVVGGLLLTGVTLLAAAIAPLAALLVGYWTGSVVDWLAGDILTNGLNDLFNTAYFDGVHYPSLFAAVYLITSLTAVVLRNKRGEQ